MAEEDKPQPKKGDVVLCCPHARKKPGPMHWWTMSGVAFRRPDGSGAEAQWAVACSACAIACGGNPMRLGISEDVIWPGGPPLKFQLGN